MTNRIRDLRLSRSMTLADLAAACDPPTTAQTIGRLETGMRRLSLEWMQKIAAALDVPAEQLIRAPGGAAPQIVAQLTLNGVEPLARPRDAVNPLDSSHADDRLVMTVEDSAGEYRCGDQVWLRKRGLEEAGALMNTDVLVPRRGGRFAFGRLIDRDGRRLVLLPPFRGAKQVVVEDPAWIAGTEILIRPLR
ncbi:XRE family transcriptional regulator [Erythrobacteraceae bacterium CFH 75059]|nr:XRE family transcriptional regulator [Erythrobacteraceae bacterium CFH 75059]